MAGRFHSIPDSSPEVFGPPTSHNQLPHIHQDVHTCAQTPKPLTVPRHTLSVIDRVEMLSGTHAARSGGGWITLLAGHLLFSVSVTARRRAAEGGRVRPGSRCLHVSSGPGQLHGHWLSLVPCSYCHYVQ